MNWKFPLETLLTIRRNEEAAQGVKLEALKARRREMMEKLWEIRSELNKQNDSFPAGGTAFEMTWNARYADLLLRRLEAATGELEKAGACEEVQRKALLAAMKERKKIEKLREMWAEKIEKARNKAETLEMDETARFQFAREGR